jgi:hypothetical protein
MVILLNILIALYNSAYEDITENAIDEYMALFSQKTMQFVRAPDENVFIAPFNLIEMFCLIIPFEWWMDDARYNKLNDYVMSILYAPLLVVTAFIETKEAKHVNYNRRRGEEDEDTVHEWEQVLHECDFESDGWDKKVQATKPNVEFDTAVLEVRKLQEQVEEMKTMLYALTEKTWGGDTLEGSKFDKLGDTVVGETLGETLGESSSSGRDE